MNPDALSRAQKFIELYTTQLNTLCEVTLEKPAILPGPDESVDLHWDYPEYEILINIPANTTAEIGVYGDNKVGTMGASVKTKLDTDSFNEILLLWLADVKTNHGK